MVASRSKGNPLADVFLDLFYLVLHISVKEKRFHLLNFYSRLKTPVGHSDLSVFLFNAVTVEKYLLPNFEQDPYSAFSSHTSCTQ